MNRVPDDAESPQRYDGVAIALHWLTALLIVANLTLGISMVGLPISPRKLHWYLWHKTIGLSVFMLTAARLGWRALHPLPPAPMPRWQRRASVVAHASLYALMFAIPISGYLYSSATGVQVVWMGVVPLPSLLPKDKALGDALRIVHVTLNTLLVGVVVVHVAAALRHHFVDRDTVLARMLPFMKLTPAGR